MQVEFPEAIEALTVTEPRMTEEQFFEFCIRNANLQIERTAQGEILVMPPACGESGYRNSEITTQLANWTRLDGRGLAFDSSTGFILPSGAVRAPDAAWVRKDWLQTLTKEQKRRHLPGCPDFLVELVSPSDRRSKLLVKMQEWMDSGAELAWMIDADLKMATIFRRGREPEELYAPEALVGEGPMDGFRLEMKAIWEGF
jgi:Uma2 family endonuclease